jgi:phosphoribosylglycinamide formyltransferase-1
MKHKTRLGVLVSGSGTNLQSILDACKTGKIDAEVVVVISNKSGAYALKRAENAGVETVVLEPKGFATREDYDKELVKILKKRNIELVILAGFMRIVTPVLIKEFPMRIMNIHPALLPAFPGLHVQKRAIEYGAKFSGCTVHFVTEEVDAGPIIIQAVVPVYENDTEDTLRDRILIEEHRIYPQAIQLFSEGKLKVEGRRVRISGCKEPENFRLENPVVEVL